MATILDYEGSIEANLLPELESLNRWGRFAYEALRERPRDFLDLDRRGRLVEFIQVEQERLSARALRLDKSWRRANPIPSGASHQERMSWYRHAHSYAIEVIRTEV